MGARLSLVATLARFEPVTREEAARRLKATLDELDGANTFALVAFADRDPEFPPAKPSKQKIEALHETMPLNWRGHYKQDLH
jgi:hypothetical protein